MDGKENSTMAPSKVKLNEHPTVKRFRETQQAPSASARPTQLEAGWLRQVCLEAGADDAGFVEIERPEIADQREDILAVFPPTRTLISYVCRMNREPIRSPARSVANLELHHTTDHINEVGHNIVTVLEQMGIRALNPAAGFPMEMDRFGKAWVVSHKPRREQPLPQPHSSE